MKWFHATSGDRTRRAAFMRSAIISAYFFPAVQVLVWVLFGDGRGFGSRAIDLQQPEVHCEGTWPKKKYMGKGKAENTYLPRYQ
jgi:hypothetical protein